MATRKQNVNDLYDEYLDDQAYLEELEERLRQQAEEEDTVREYAKHLAKNQANSNNS